MNELLSMIIRSKIFKISVLVTLLIIGISIVYYFYSHGRVDISKIDTSEFSVKITKQHINGPPPEPITFKGSRLTLPSGLYFADITNNKTGINTSVGVDIGHFFKVSTVEFDAGNQSQAHTSSLAASSANFITEKDGIVYSFSKITGKIITHRSFLENEILEGCYEEDCFRPQPYTNNRVIGFLQEYNLEEGSSYVSQSPYSENLDVAISELGTNSITVIDHSPKITASQTKASIITSPHTDKFAVYNGDKKIYVFDNPSSTPKEIQLKEQVSFGESSALVNISNDFITYVSGDDYKDPDTGDDHSESGLDADDSIYIADQSIHKISLNDDRETVIVTKKSLTVRNMALSPDANHAVVLKANFAEIYDLTTGKSQTIEQLKDSSLAEWVDNKTVIYNDSINSLISIDTSNNKRLLFSNKDINISNFNYMDGNIYLTGFYKKDYRQDMYAFKIDRSKVATQNNELFSAFPGQNAKYSNVFYMGGNKFLVQKVSDDIHGEQVGSEEKFIKSLVDNPDIETVERISSSSAL